MKTSSYEDDLDHRDSNREKSLIVFSFLFIYWIINNKFILPQERKNQCDSLDTQL